MGSPPSLLTYQLVGEMPVDHGVMVPDGRRGIKPMVGASQGEYLGPPKTMWTAPVASTIVPK